MYVVYILYSQQRSRYYVGQTNDINKRLERHNNGLVPSTKGGSPWQLIKTLDVANRSEALKLERRIMKRGAKRFLEDNQFGVYHANAWQVSPGLPSQRHVLAKPEAWLSRRVWDAEVVTLEA